jgi:hypothetical protein
MKKIFFGFILSLILVPVIGFCSPLELKSFSNFDADLLELIDVNGNLVNLRDPIYSITSDGVFFNVRVSSVFGNNNEHNFKIKIPEQLKLVYGDSDNYKTSDYIHFEFTADDLQQLYGGSADLRKIIKEFESRKIKRGCVLPSGEDGYQFFKCFTQTTEYIFSFSINGPESCRVLDDCHLPSFRSIPRAERKGICREMSGCLEQ